MKGRVLQAFAGIAVSALALWFTLRGKPLGPVWEAIRQADYRYLREDSNNYYQIRVSGGLVWYVGAKKQTKTK